MKAERISYTNNYPQNFQGTLKIKAPNASKNIVDAINNFPYLNEIAKNNDVVARVKKVYARMFDINHNKGESLYKVFVSVLKEGSVKDRILDALYLKKRYPLTNGYHSEHSTLMHLNEGRYNRIG